MLQRIGGLFQITLNYIELHNQKDAGNRFENYPTCAIFCKGAPVAVSGVL